MTADERISLLGVKVERARKHIHALEFEVRAFLDTNPYAIGTKTNPQRPNTLIYYLVSTRDTPQVIASIAGDALFNLRSALDHLAYQLALVGGGTGKNTYFPISEDAKKYMEGKPRKTRGMRSDAIKEIDALEPYKDGNDILWRLHALNNIDKHRMLITVGSAVRGIRYDNQNRRHLIKAIHADAGISVSDVEADAKNFFSNPAYRIFPLKSDSELLVDPFKREIEDKVQFDFEVSFNESGIAEGEPLVESLNQTAELVDSIILAFKPLLS